MLRRIVSISKDRVPDRSVTRFLVVDYVCHLIGVSQSSELHGGAWNIFRMVLIQPCAPRDITVLIGLGSLFVDVSGEFSLLEPILAAVIANVAGPSTSLCAIILADRNPSYTDSVFPGGKTDVLGAHTRGILSDHGIESATLLDV
jgi:hypothetical protein